MKKCRISHGDLKRLFITFPMLGSTRPTSDIVRESIYNVLIHRFDVKFNEFCVIDLFAGTGALGIEAISCGARNVLFVDSNPLATKSILVNLRAFNILGSADIICRKVELIPDSLFIEVAANSQKILIFMDPPYAENELLLKQISRFKSIFSNKHLLIVSESDKPIESCGSCEKTHVLTHGNTIVSIFESQ